MYIPRAIEKAILKAIKFFPVVVITGPRQSGKTTLVKNLFTDKDYVNLEFPDVSEQISEDPKAFFRQHPEGAIIDEVQRLPELIRYIQAYVDQNEACKFILTGSNQFLLMNQITESLAGRVAIFKLMPFSLKEIQSSIDKFDTDELLLKGLYPVIHTRQSPHKITYQNYYETYLERDIRNMMKIKNMNEFRKFVRLCAGRTGQIFNASALAGETGVAVDTIKSWISLLEASFVIYMLPPWHDNINKRLIKSPKIYFTDTGLLSYLLRIENTNQISRDPLRGSIFENMVINEFIKSKYNQGQNPELYFMRDNHGNEVDLIIPDGGEIKGVEIKSAVTFHSGFISGLFYLHRIYGDRNTRNMLIFDGDDIGTFKNVEVYNFRNQLGYFV